MRVKRYRPEEIVSQLRQVEVLGGRGTARTDAIRKIGITERKCHRLRKQYGGVGTEQLRELKRLRQENERPLRAVST